jgi:hypothetical protein
VAPENGGTAVLLGEGGRIRLPGVGRLDDDDLAFR